MEEQNRAPLVSVIMPAYQAEPFIGEAVGSVLAQSVTDLELIVLDDGSTDRTREIVRDFAQRDHRVRLVVNEENMGVARTRNRGLDLCRGTYVALLDSDDYWQPRMLERMIARAEETGADIIYCSYALVDEQGRKICNDFIVPPTTSFEESIVRSVITCSSVLVTGSLARAHWFPTNVYHEDIALWFQLLKDGCRACGVTEVLAAYRQRANSRAGNKLTSAIRRWEIYRHHLGMPLGKCMSTMVRYGYYGLKKFKRIS